MNFCATPISGVWLIELQPIEDERGFFARTFDRDAFIARGLNPHLEQCSVSFNRKKGTLRGMHFQLAPHGEAKLVRCTQGTIYDVALDLRPQSETFKQWFAVELSTRNRKMLYIPEGCAHGLQTLEDNSEVFYQISTAYHAESATGVRWDDAVFNIEWPLPVAMMAARDAEWPDFAPEARYE